MAQVICSLSLEQITGYMPVREMPDSLNEIYHAAGDELDREIKLQGEYFQSPECYLVKLADGREVAFPFGFALDWSVVN